MSKGPKMVQCTWGRMEWESGTGKALGETGRSYSDMSARGSLEPGLVGPLPRPRASPWVSMESGFS